jgi:hypothetical protein
LQPNVLLPLHLIESAKVQSRPLSHQTIWMLRLPAQEHP